MTGNSAKELRDGLIALLQSERLDARCMETGIVALAAELGLRTVMRFGGNQKERHAMLSPGPVPEISLFRNGPPRKPVEVRPRDEPRLKSHERFSIAHEIGHWLAHKRLDIAPVNSAERSSEYWKHEGAINEFVGKLLVPDVKLFEVLVPWKEGMHIPSQFIEPVASDLKVSRITLCRRISDVRSDFGYLELEFNKDPKLSRLILVVKESASGGAFTIPANLTKIRNDRLVEVLRGSLRGRRFMPSTSFNGKLIQSLYLSWSHIAGKSGSGGSGDAAWRGRLVMTNWSLTDVNQPFMDNA